MDGIDLKEYFVKECLKNGVKKDMINMAVKSCLEFCKLSGSDDDLIKLIINPDLLPIDDCLELIHSITKKHNGWTNYATWYIAVEINNREEIYNFLIKKVNEGWTISDLIGFFMNGINNPFDVRNPDFFKIWFLDIKKELSITDMYKPMYAVNWIEIITDFINDLVYGCE